MNEVAFDAKQDNIIGIVSVEGEVVPYITKAGPRTLTLLLLLINLLLYLYGQGLMLVLLSPPPP